MNIEIHDELPPEDNAMLQALYSRSPASVAQHLAELRDGRNSGPFMERYYVGYGHQSIGDCGSTTVFVEGVSMLVAKAIQDWPLYSGQEASTRYMDFGEVPFSDPLGTPQSSRIQERWRVFYLDALQPVREHVRRRYPRQEGEDEKVYERAVAARVFDVLRAFLPAGATTNLSWHTNLRQASDHLGWLLCHPDPSVEDVAQQIHDALQARYPSSFADIPPSDYRRMTLWVDYYLEDRAPRVLGEVHMSGIGQSDLESKLALLGRRPKGAPVPWYYAEHGLIQSSFLLDFGSFRDLQRHRNGTVRMPLLTMEHGFHHWYLDELPSDLAAAATELLNEQELDIEALRCDPITAQSYIPMGCLVPCRATQSLPAFVYRLELRSSKTVHPTLRSIILEEIRRFRQRFPDIPLHVDTDPDSWTVRRGQQTITAKETP